MRTSVVIVENFYADPLAVRQYALGQRFYYPYQADADVESGRKPFSWMSSWFQRADRCPFKSSAPRSRGSKRSPGIGSTWTTGTGISRSPPRGRPTPIDWRPGGVASGTAFHFKPENNQPLGEGVHSHVVDMWNGVGEDGWAGLVYLTLMPRCRVA